MLAIDSSRFKRPKYSQLTRMWLLQPNEDNGTSTYADKFSYTILESNGKMTFMYDGKSVKASPRTLRIYGAEIVNPLISELAQTKITTDETQVTKEVDPDLFTTGDLDSLLASTKV